MHHIRHSMLILSPNKKKILLSQHLAHLIKALRVGLQFSTKINKNKGGGRLS